MLVAITLFGEFLTIIQVIVWIVLPVLLFSLLTVVLLHYGRKWKRNNSDTEAIQLEIAGESPENFCYKNGEGKLVYLDHTGLLKDFRNRLSYSHARYAALQQDFTKLKAGVLSPAMTGNDRFILHKNYTMEHRNNEMHVVAQESNENRIVADHEGTKDLPLSSHSKTQDCLKAMLEEKKKQVDFLQDQVDLRIQSYYQSEQEREELKAALENLQQKEQHAGEATEQLRKELEQQEATISALELNLADQSRQLTENQQQLVARQEHIIYLDNLLEELRQQNRLLDASIADANDRNGLLQEKLQTEESKVTAMEQKLTANRQLLQRLYNEFSNCLNEDASASPVISLRTDFITKENRAGEWDEVAVQ